MAEHRVLIVDDDRMTRWLYAIALQQRDLEVDVAESMRLALDLLEMNAELYCCVILDLVLPDGDGLEIATRIRDKAPTLPVIVVTGHPERPIAEDLGRVIRMVISKPVEPAILGEYVHRECPRLRD